MPFYSFFDSPEEYDNSVFYKQGGSPGLLAGLIQFIEERKELITEINLCWYLFNNKKLYDYLVGLSKLGIKVNIVSIPLEGYDGGNPRKITDIETGELSEGQFSKFGLARLIFQDAFYKENENLSIKFFPHIYLRSQYVKPFSRGEMPYSLHIKAGLIKKKDGYVALLSSSSMAVRDLVKHESMVFVEDEPGYREPIWNFFQDIRKVSIPIKKFTSELNSGKNDYEQLNDVNNPSAHFTAPFYFDSPHLLENKVIALLKNAKNKIIIAAQHLAAYNYQFKSRFHSKIQADEIRKGILGVVVEKAKEGLEITCLSQTFSAPEELAEKFESDHFREPSNKKSFSKLVTDLAKQKNARYFVNQDFHSKFIIIDETLIFCSYNFTPTQFIFLDKVDIKKFTHMPGKHYKGQHCEVSGHFVINDKETLRKFEKNVEYIIGLKNTVQTLPLKE